jgi:hypothetical protein
LRNHAGAQRGRLGEPRIQVPHESPSSAHARAPSASQMSPRFGITPTTSIRGR